MTDVCCVTHGDGAGDHGASCSILSALTALSFMSCLLWSLVPLCWLINSSVWQLVNFQLFLSGGPEAGDSPADLDRPRLLLVVRIPRGRNSPCDYPSAPVPTQMTLQHRSVSFCEQERCFGTFCTVLRSLREAHSYWFRPLCFILLPFWLLLQGMETPNLSCSSPPSNYLL